MRSVLLGRVLGARNGFFRAGWWLILAGTLALSPAAVVEAETNVDGPPDASLLAAHIQYFADVSGRLDVDAVARPDSEVIFAPLPEGRASFGTVDGAIWLRLAARDLPPAGGTRLLEVGAPVLDDLRVYLWRGDGAVDAFHVGDLRPFSARSRAYRGFVFPLPETLPEDAIILVRAESAGFLRVPLKLWTESAFLEWDAVEQLILGLYFGVLAAMVLYNAAVFAALRDASYAYYVLYLSALMLLQLTLSGYGSQYLWPRASNVANNALLFFFGATIAFGMLFVRHFLRLPGRKVVDNWVMIVIALLAALSMAVAWIAPYRLVLTTMILLAVAAIAGTIFVIARAFARGYRPARFLILAFAALAPGFVVLLLRSTGAIPETALTAHAVEFSTALEAILLAFALADRISLLERERQQALVEVHRAREVFSRELIDRQERDRRRIASELHDSVGQSLLVIRNGVLDAARGSAPEAAGALEGVAEQAAATVNEVREICQDLHPHQLERLGLASAIEAMADKAFEATGIHFDVNLDLGATGDGRSTVDQIHLYRIAQEAVSNVLRHADATRCAISLRRQDGALELTVEDNGRGLVDGHDDGRPRFGLMGMQERARFLGGAVKIDGLRDGGTRVRAEVPDLGSEAH